MNDSLTHVVASGFAGAMFLLIAHLVMKAGEHLYARTWCAWRKRRQARDHRIIQEALAAADREREQRIGAVMAQASLQMPLGPMVEEVPYGVDVTPLLRYTICALKAQDHRRFMPAITLQEYDS